MRPPEALERRKRENHALRALYNRVETLEKLLSDQDKAVTALEREAVTYKALSATVLALSLALFGGAWKFSAGIQEAAAQTTASAVASQTAAVTSQAQKLDAFIERQASTNIKTEALYLLSVERKPREEVRAVVLQTAKEK